jgi:hypothetical protein
MTIPNHDHSTPTQLITWVAPDTVNIENLNTGSHDTNSVTVVEVTVIGSIPHHHEGGDGGGV